MLVAKWCPALCDPVDCSRSGSSVHGILQARILEWGAIPSSRGSSRPRGGTRIFWGLPDSGMEPRGSPALQADSVPSEPPGKPVSYTGAELAPRVALVSGVWELDWLIHRHLSLLSQAHFPIQVISVCSAEFPVVFSGVFDHHIIYRNWNMHIPNS